MPDFIISKREQFFGLIHKQIIKIYSNNSVWKDQDIWFLFSNRKHEKN